ncbi:MAG: hypothetical protein JO256_10775 [Alphaproteobacteria bacterium]|nr:hypothetical protein [Alphaproteobacteria bacterium]
MGAVQKLVVMTALIPLGGCLFSDPDWGLKRTAAVKEIPTEQCVLHAAEAVPGVREAHSVPYGGRRGFAKPDALYFALDILPIAHIAFAGGIQFVRRNGQDQYEAYYTAAHFAPSETDASLMREIFVSLEGRIDSDCGLSGMSHRVVEACNHLKC